MKRSQRKGAKVHERSRSGLFGLVQCLTFEIFLHLVSVLAVLIFFRKEDTIGCLALGTSFLVSFLASMARIVWLIRMLKQQRLYWFSIYLVLMATYVFVASPPDTRSEKWFYTAAHQVWVL